MGSTRKANFTIIKENKSLFSSIKLLLFRIIPIIHLIGYVNESPLLEKISVLRRFNLFEAAFHIFNGFGELSS